MNNAIGYNDIMAFHPGYYVGEIIEDMGITQAEFAKRLGTTGKTVSGLVNGQINLSGDLAKKLSAMLGSSVKFWLNLQTAFEEKVLKIERQKEIDAQIEVVSIIDYSFFERVANLPRTKSKVEQVTNLCQYFVVSDIRIFEQPDFLANFRSGIGRVEKKNIINAQAWLQTALNYAKEIKTNPFDADKLKSYLPEIKAMTLQSADAFVPRLQEIFSECGGAFVLLPHLKNSGINGVVKWINTERVVLAMNDRRTYADTFWFSLFHEIKHVLQQKVKTVFLSGDTQDIRMIDEKLEYEADKFAQDYLISPSDYRRFAPSKYTSDAQIIEFSSSIGVHPGIVAGRLIHDKVIAPNRCSRLREKYKIVLQ